eukprot:g7061.t1
MDGIRLPPRLFRIAQTSGLYTDSKSLVDRPVKIHFTELQSRWTEFEASWNGTKEALKTFIQSITSNPGSDLVPVDPEDWTEKTEEWLAEEVSGKALRQWLYFLNKQWKVLCRKTNIIRGQENRHTLIPLSSFHFVPGDRFRETYYWDSHWTVLGLLVCDMFDSAMNQVETLVSLLDSYGHIPNGARSYYLNRSQPPILSITLRTVLEEIQHNKKASVGHKKRVVELIRKSFKLLIREHEFWTTEPHLVKIRDSSGGLHYLSRYFAETHTPRPEAYKEDLATFEASEKDSSELYCELASAAESGWDFSSRWLADPNDLSSIQTTRVLPVDLNGLLFALEMNIAYFATVLADQSTTAECYTQKARDRQLAFDALLWDANSCQWRDLYVNKDTDECAFVRDGYLSNYVPLYCGVRPPSNEEASGIVSGLKTSPLFSPGGFAASIYETGQQWDGANVWPPLQCFIIEGLMQLSRSHPLSGADKLASEAASRFLMNMFVGFKTQSLMFEKYHAEDLGRTGSGGEYRPQSGFGWTNGVALWLIKQHFAINLESYKAPPFKKH